MQRTKQRISLMLTALLLLGLAACGGQTASVPSRETETTKNQSGAPSDTLKGIYDALTAPDSYYSQNKAMYAEYYPELEYTETLADDRITISLKANGNEYISDGSWAFVEDGSWLTAVMDSDDFSGVSYVLEVADAIGSYFGMEHDLISGYLNGLGALEITNDNFSVSEDEAAGTTTYKLNIAGPWDMKELDQMLLDESVLDAEPLDDEFISRSGNIGKIRMIANGSAESCNMLFAEFGELDDIAYRSIVNVVMMMKPIGWEDFLADFTELKDLDTDGYTVNLDPDDATVADLMGERNEKFSYVQVQFGSTNFGEDEYEGYTE